MAKPPTITTRGRELEVCTHGDCLHHRFWDYATCWKHLKDAERIHARERLSDMLRRRRSLAGLVLTGGNFSGMDFSGADLRDVFLDECNLDGSLFVEANLGDAYLGWSYLENADLRRAELHGCVFTNCNLKNVRLYAYSLSFGREPVNLYSHLFGDTGLIGRPHINESEPEMAQATYRALKRYFVEQADYDSVSWASYCEKVMQRKGLWKRETAFRWLVSALFAFSCGYGEKPSRVVFSAASTAALFAILFRSLRCVTLNGSPLSALQSLYFSFATLSGYSFPDMVPNASSWTRFIVAGEAFSGILLLGLFVFTLTQRFVAR